MTANEGAAHMRGTMEGLEWAFADITERDLIASRPDENGAGVFVFDDGATARTLTDAVDYGKVLTRFAHNQLRQSAG